MHVPARAPVLGDGALTLRPHHPGDLDAIVEQCRDPLMQRWTVVPSPYRRRDAEEFLAGREAAWTSGDSLSFAVQDSTGQEHDGFAGTVDLRMRGRTMAEVGYALGPWARGRGVTRQALGLLLPWAFDTLGLQTVHWRAQVGHWASRRVAWSLGFRVLGTVPGLLEQRGESRDGWLGWLERGDQLRPAHPWHVPPVLQAPNVGVVLRPHTGSDLDRLVEACDDPQTASWLDQLPSPYRTQDGLRFLRQVADEHAGGRAVHWAVADAADDRFLAQISLFRLDTGTRSGEIGYLAHPAERGRGVVTAAVRLVARHALLPEPDGGLGLDRVWLVVDAPNAASARVAVKAGLRPAGTDRAAGLRRDGSRCDQVRFDLLAHELEAVRP